MIIDCHGHYTTAPKELQDYRDKQVAELKDPRRVSSLGAVHISDDQIRESLEGAQLKLQRERGTDITFFSPRAGSMEHHVGGPAGPDQARAASSRERSIALPLDGERAPDRDSRRDRLPFRRVRP